MNIAIVFGGKSIEHDVSIVTAKQIFNVKNQSKLIYVDKDGNLNLYSSTKFEFKDFKDKNNNLTPIILKDGYVYKKTLSKYKKVFKLDCAIFCTHGGDGENGKLASHFTSSGVPVTAGSSLALAISMNKWLTKVFLKGLKIDCVDGFCVQSNYDINNIDKQITSSFGYPVIIKPNGGGSSIGIQVVKNKEELKEGLSVALEFDNSCIIEKEIVDFIEYNCGVFGDGQNAITSKIDKPEKKDEILSFKDKYLSGNKQKEKGMKGQTRTFPAKLSIKLETKIQDTSKRIFAELGFFGVIRIDYIYEQKTKRLFVNEINAIPGSLATYFFTNKNLSVNEFLDNLVKIGINNYNKNSQINKNFITKLF